MDITLNQYDAISLRLTTISPNARTILNRETFSLNLESEEITSEAVLQDLIVGLRDDMASLGLYLTVPLGDLYANFNTLNDVITAFEWIFPNTLYPKIRSDICIKPQIQNLLEGSIGNDSTILLYLNWLGCNPDSYAPECQRGAQWLSTRLMSNGIFDQYLHQLVDSNVSLDHQTTLSPEDLASYIETIKHLSYGFYQTLDTLMGENSLSQAIASFEAALRRRFDLFTRHCLQPNKAAEYAWLMSVPDRTLSPDLLKIKQLRIHDFMKSHKLYGAYYQEKPPSEISLLDLAGVAIQTYVTDGKRLGDRGKYVRYLIRSLRGNISDDAEKILKNDLTAEQNRLIAGIGQCLYP